MDVNVILNDFERLKKACDDMAGKKILVGLVGGVDSEVLKIAIAHEYGTEKLPERSFIRASFDADQAKLGEIVSGAIGKVLSGQTSADAAANAIGAQAAPDGAELHRRQPGKTAVGFHQENAAHDAV